MRVRELEAVVAAARQQEAVAEAARATLCAQLENGARERREQQEQHEAMVAGLEKENKQLRGEVNSRDEEIARLHSGADYLKGQHSQYAVQREEELTRLRSQLVLTLLASCCVVIFLYLFFYVLYFVTA